jgi:hypothetical protein
MLSKRCNEMRSMRPGFQTSRSILFGESVEKRSEILLPRLRDQNDICEMGKVLFSRDSCESRVTPK